MNEASSIVPRVALLGVCDRVNKERNFDPRLYQLSVSRLRSEVVSYIYPLPLRGLQILLAVHNYRHCRVTQHSCLVERHTSPHGTILLRSCATGSSVIQIRRLCYKVAHERALLSAASVTKVLYQIDTLERNRALNTNIRFRWEYQPGSDLVVVYSEGRETDLRPHESGLRNRGFAIKLTRLLRF